MLGSGGCTSVSLAWSTAVTVSRLKSRWRGVEEEEEEQPPSQSSASCSSSALTEGCDPEPAAETTPSPLVPPGWDGSSGSSADTKHTHRQSQVCSTAHHLDLLLLHHTTRCQNTASGACAAPAVLPSLQASRTVQFSSICSDTTVENCRQRSKM